MMRCETDNNKKRGNDADVEEKIKKANILYDKKIVLEQKRFRLNRWKGALQRKVDVLLMRKDTC
jgi:hypothetical protein